MKTLKIAAVAAAAAAPMLALANSAPAVDTSAITATLTPIAAVGAAVFAVAVGIKLFKWVRRAL